MGERDPLERPCWFFVSIGDDLTFGNLIVWAGSRLEVYEKFQNPVKVVKVTPLSWRGLKELTGCSIPINEEPDDYARGEIMFQYNSRAISILPNVSMDVIGV
ncbi:hypothetical protein LCGC14_0872440 [marine sediment metagenome]|uniref:Uncharacterized protein n=1 Tax=marine sediment metagenome TaxID=412755 RepID=A0A0F9PPW9_9ZZZZ